ncbi:uncharacterized protein LOC129894661 [Solanum dulcamara]|uniref:uncharacterized protein LOC129894661 n=1 Tax=Solanum dulcamara TaxID=45834 RepID=UPI00248638D8|nr:uncharacterized protein LOC129894661 [Solanum dulcamara]
MIDRGLDGGLTPAFSREIGEKSNGLGACSSSGDMNNMWDMTAGCIRKEVAEVLGISRGIFGGCQGDWWWNGEVQGKVKAKKVAYTEWLECVDEEEKNRVKDIYKKAKTKAKSVVTIAKTTTFERVYVELGEKDGDKRLYRLAKAKEKKVRDLDLVKCIKDEESKVNIQLYNALRDPTEPPLDLRISFRNLNNDEDDSKKRECWASTQQNAKRECRWTQSKVSHATKLR